MMGYFEFYISIINIFLTDIAFTMWIGILVKNAKLKNMNL